MTHSYPRLVLQRSALILLATTALSASVLSAGPALAKAHHRAHPAAAKTADEPEASTYTVKKGDTLEKIADQLGTSIEELQRLNKLKKTSILKPGQVLKGPPVEKPAAKGASAKGDGAKGDGAKGEGGKKSSYTVAKGDTLFSISKRLGVSIDDLRAANGLSAKGQIHAGQTLKLPGAADEAEASPKSAAKSEPAKGGKGRKGKPAAEPAEDTAPSGGGKVVTTQAKGESYKVKKGDTIAKVADRLDTDIGTLKRLNHLRGNAVKPGQVLRGPSFAEHVYVAEKGDTLASIAQRFGVSVASLRAENELSKKANSVRPGQKVYLPEGYHDPNAPSPPTRYAQPYPPSRGGEEPTMPAHPVPYSSLPGAAQVQPPPMPGPSDDKISQLAKGRFVWPLTGTILKDFGAKPGGQHNDGIDLKANTGDPVRASADGEVVYAGDQVPGFGNLVLIKHSEEWSTVYAYLGHIDVKNRQKVTQGQQIGQAGMSGGVTEPQVHFEVRYTASPTDHPRAVDPKLVLPKP